MITEEQARVLFDVPPAGSIDARRVLAKGRRARRYRRGAAACTAVATSAVVVVAAGAVPRDTTGVDVANSPTPTASPSPTVDPRWPLGRPVVLGAYTDPGTGERREVAAFFEKGKGSALSVCAGTIDAHGSVTADLGCSGTSPYPGPDKHFVMTGPSGGEELGADSTPGPFGWGWSYEIVSTKVFSGGIYDETGALHEGRVLGTDDPQLPFRFLVTEYGNHWWSGVVLRDANGRVIEERGPFVRDLEPPIPTATPR